MKKSELARRKALFGDMTLMKITTPTVVTSMTNKHWGIKVVVTNTDDTFDVHVSSIGTSEGVKKRHICVTLREALVKALDIVGAD